jgi:hypothetical protein
LDPALPLNVMLLGSVQLEYLAITQDNRTSLDFHQ